MELDGYCEQLNLAFEYDGEFHYKDHFSGDKLDKRQRYDKIKDELCIKNGVRLIRIPYFEQNKEQYIKDQLFQILNNIK